MDAASAPSLAEELLPRRFSAWFASRGWTVRSHQLAMIEKAQAGRDALLIAPTGGGKTLAGFLPSLIELADRPATAELRTVHTLYISPLKALAVDVHRNLEVPIAEMGLDIAVEARTGDTSLAKRERQKLKPPDILITTPEQLALFCAWPGGRAYFADLRCVILDEIHVLHGSKRGDMLNLALARLQRFAPSMRRVGLSATVNDPDMLCRWLVSQNPSPSKGEGQGWGCAQDIEGGTREAVAPPTLHAPPEARVPPPNPPPSRGRAPDAPPGPKMADLVLGAPGAPPVVDIMTAGRAAPWSGWNGQARHPRRLYCHQGRQDRAGVRQHPLPGRAQLPDAVGGERRQPSHRSAPRLACD